MVRFALFGLVLSLLGGCGVVSGAAGVVGTAVNVAASAAETTVDVVTAPVR